jgi:SagB-type dehydrogenase family enzyme
VGSTDPFFRWTELDAASFPEWRERIVAFEPDSEDHEPRSYAGYPRWPLPAVRARLWPPLDRILARRRRHGRLGTTAPRRSALARLLRHAHGITASAARGPVPSAGGLQALELYLVSWTDGWLPPGVYHYDRAGQWLAQLVPGAQREAWHELVPSLGLVEGGALLWVLVGDGRRVARKYAERGYRFLLLEAGHLMQNLCLLSESLGLCTVPLGGFLERAIARRLVLPDEDLVPYVAVCGAPVRQVSGSG